MAGTAPGHRGVTGLSPQRRQSTPLTAGAGCTGLKAARARPCAGWEETCGRLVRPDPPGVRAAFPAVSRQHGHGPATSLMNNENLLSVLVIDRPRRSLPGRPAGTWPWSRRLGESASEGDARDCDDARHSAQTRRATAAGRRQLAGRSGTFACIVHRAGRRPVRGRLPLTGEVRITEPIEDSTARLAARTSAVSTGSPVLDRLLAGPAFLDARAFPEISFRSELLVWVPAGWRAVGRLQVKNTEHELACQLSLHPGDTRPGGPRIIIAGSWAIDSRWVTSQRIPALGRRIVMTCSCLLELGM